MDIKSDVGVWRLAFTLAFLQIVITTIIAFIFGGITMAIKRSMPDSVHRDVPTRRPHGSYYNN